MNFTQPTTKCSMWSWKSQDIRFPGLIILEHSRSLMNGLAAKMLALIILPDFDGQKVSVAPVAGVLQKSHLWLDVVSFFAENVNGKHPLLRGPCFIRRTNHWGHGFLPCGLWQAKSMEPALSVWKEFLGLAAMIPRGLGFINCVVRWYDLVEISWQGQLRLMKYTLEALKQVGARGKWLKVRGSELSIHKNKVWNFSSHNWTLP